MVAERLKRSERIEPKRKGIPERQQYRRHLWNMLFLEFLIGKLQERDFWDMEADLEVRADVEIIQGAEAGIGVGIKIEAQPVARRKETYKSRERKLLSGSHGAFPPMGRDTLELSLFCFENMLCSENYMILAACVKRTESLIADRLFCEARRIMEDYYGGGVDLVTLEVIYRQYCLFGELSAVYECFARENARRAVLKNREEGKMLVEESGLSWAGTTYYNAAYYRQCQKVAERLREITLETAGERSIPAFDFEEAEEQSRFYADGGLTFHGVFEWLQRQNNFPAMHYGFQDKTKEPPECFLYLYRNGYDVWEEQGVFRLKEKLTEMFDGMACEEKLEKSFRISGGTDYHNGESYLLQEEEGFRGQIMDFLRNFRLFRVCGCVELLFAGR
ncbi:MAG: hypothetical protein PUB98_09430 [Clostridiales bacterium]|nr:hypothetical protein [Clostridiales bacterium]